MREESPPGGTNLLNQGANRAGRLFLFVLQSCTSHYNAGTWGIVQGQLRPLLAPRVYTLPMVRSIGKTMVQGKNYGPQITVKRISTRSVLLTLSPRFSCHRRRQTCCLPSSYVCVCECDRKKHMEQSSGDLINAVSVALLNMKIIIVLQRKKKHPAEIAHLLHMKPVLFFPTGGASASPSLFRSPVRW